MDTIRITLAQLNPTLGDLTGNAEKLRTVRAEHTDSHIIMTAELFMCGYPPEDLVLKQSFMNNVEATVRALADETRDGGPAILLGTPWIEADKLYNAMLLLDGGKIAGRAFKHELPNYGPFDEKRTFTSWPMPDVIPFRGIKLGVMICEDMWFPKVARILKERGATALLVSNGSPFEKNKFEARIKHARARISETKLPLAYVQQIGGQDELVFDGASFVLDAAGTCMAQLGSWQEECRTVTWDIDDQCLYPHKNAIIRIPSGEEATYRALMLGLRDYVNKNGFKSVLLGLSGGIDSALVATLAVDALGADRVWAVMMPSPFTSQASLDDAKDIAMRLGCRYDQVDIEPLMATFQKTLAPLFTGTSPDVTEENIQARCRGVILMALSNKFGAMVISTGNKSEMSVGYSTLYGDLCGGYAVIKDLYKTEVYKVSSWRNQFKPDDALGPSGTVISESIIEKAPTAELRPNQTDQDSLPPYPVLDAILQGLIEHDGSTKELERQGHPPATITRVWTLLDHAEYKRRQAPIGVKITEKSLGKDRRYPITNKSHPR